MPQDRFIYWLPCSHPTRESVILLVQDFCLGLGVLREEGNRLFVTLPGSPRWPYQRVGPAAPHQREAWLEMGRDSDGTPRPRWIEVVFGEDNVDVLTRSQDPITNAIADGLALALARGFQGRTEDEMNQFLAGTCSQ